MHTYNNRFIIGTFNPVLGYQVWANAIENLIRQRDFVKISKNWMGRGKIFNLFVFPQDGARSFETFKSRLYTGTTNWVNCATGANETGCEVWRVDHIS